MHICISYMPLLVGFVIFVQFLLFFSKSSNMISFDSGTKGIE